MCCCNHISDELGRALDTNDLECCIQNKPECNCCSGPKPIEKGKFGLAYVVETPRRKYTKPTGWEVEFEDTPSNISYNCKKMTQWANRPPIVECLEKETHFCSKSYEIRKLSNNDDKKPCCCTHCVAKKVPCCCPEPRKCCNSEPPRCGCCRETPKCGCCPEPPKCTCSPEPPKCTCSTEPPKCTWSPQSPKCTCCPQAPKCTCCSEPPKCSCSPESPKCGCSQKMCVSYYTKLPDCQKCNCNKKCLCQLDEEDLNCSCNAARKSMKESSRKKRCKCKSEKRSSPDRGDYSFSKSRPKSGHRKKKVKQYTFQEDRDDSLDYIPRKETKRDNWRPNETGRNLTEREKTFTKEKGEDKKSNFTLTENFDRTYNARGNSPQFQNEKSYRDETVRTERNYRDNTGNTPFENTNLNSTRMDSYAKTFNMENRNNITAPMASIREDTFMNSTQKDNTFSSDRNEFLTSSPRQSFDASRNTTTIKQEPNTTVTKEKLISEPIPLPWKDTTQMDETVNEKKYDHRRDPTPLLQKIRRAHHKQIEGIEMAREAEVHSATLP